MLVGGVGVSGSEIAVVDDLAGLGVKDAVCEGMAYMRSNVNHVSLVLGGLGGEV